jgi:hypothetical protein
MGNGTLTIVISNNRDVGVDFFTIATCHVKEAGTEFVVKSECTIFQIPYNTHERPSIAAECVSEHGKSQCAAINGECVTERDGYYLVSAVCMIFGVIFLLGYTIPTARKLQCKSGIIFFFMLWNLLSCLQHCLSPSGALMSGENQNNCR